MKPANLLLNGNMEIKVGDFGLAVKLGFKGERRSSICGTPNFMAPEQLSKVPGHSYSADVWAMGVIMFIMLTGHVPFAEGATKVEVVYKNIEKRNYDWPTDV
jgi:serine/threonine protein kinase